MSLVARADFSAGMFRSVARELIPRNGVYDIENGLLDEEGVVYRRGGASFLTALWGAGPLTTVWSGRLGGNDRVVVADGADLRSFDPATWTAVHTGGAITGPPSFRPVVYKDHLIAFGGATYDGAVFSDVVTLGGSNFSYYATVAGRLVGATEGSDQVHFTGFDTWVFAATDFHRIPGGGIIGLEPIRDGVAVFTTNGVWLITGLSNELTDAAGNVQQRIDLFSKDLILWHNAGIAAYEGGLVIPARDGVWLMQTGITSEPALPFQRISAPIDRYYRGVVETGVLPGVGAVFQGYYFLPLNSADAGGVGSNGVLVCRLDGIPTRDGMLRPWTRLSGHASNVTGFAQDKSSASGPVLLGITNQSVGGRIMGMDFFDPTVTTDADGSVGTWSVTSGDLATGRGNENQITKLRAGYTLQSAATADMQASLENGPLALTGNAPETMAEPDTFTWPVGKKRRYGRFKLSCTDASSDLTLRSLEMFTRDSGRQ